MAGTVPPTSQPRTAAVPSSSAAEAAVEATTSVAAAAAGGMALSAEEEAFKRNTDCVYFLASPLTCKKGSECEYRHSDIARVNPRDCWYWLHGNCLNPKCAFRHPPLDGLLGNQMPNPAGVPGPASQPAITQTAPASFSSGKQPVACIFFQKGSCLKGDWCPFFHGPNSANNKVMQSQAAIPATEPAMFKKTFGLEKCTQEKKATQTIQKHVELITPAKLSNKVESTPAKQGFNSDKKFHHSSGTVELHGYRPIDTRLANDGSRVPFTSRMQPTLQVNSHATTLNGKDAEEVSREPSPGFDVLVDNELGDSDYYHSEDQFVRARDHEGMVEYFDNQSGDYSSRGDTDRDLYHDSRAYDSYERLRGQYATEPRKSSERMSGGLTHQDRRRYGRADSPDQVEQQSDLRLRLSKHRRGNSLRSVINHDHARERSDDRRPQGFQRDPGHDRERQETSLSSRLRGRIKIPGSSTSVTDGKDQRLDREVERGRDHRRLSPGRSQASSRVRDRIKGLVQEGISNDDRNNRGEHMRRDLMGDITTHFAAPKSLAELQGRKNADGSDQQLVGKRKYSKTDYQQQTGDDLSFEGPKPLEEILKRKRRSRMAEFEGNQSNNQDTIEETRDFASSNKNSSLPIFKNEDYKSAAVKSVTEGVPSTEAKHTNDAEVEEGMILEDGAAEDQEPEAYDHGDEEFDYEQGDGDNFNLDDAENGDAEEEYLDDDDDEFAKKLGVMY